MIKPSLRFNLRENNLHPKVTMTVAHRNQSARYMMHIFYCESFIYACRNWAGNVHSKYGPPVMTDVTIAVSKTMAFLKNAIDGLTISEITKMHF